MHKRGAVVGCVHLLEFFNQRSQELMGMSEGRLPWTSSIQWRTRGSPRSPPISGLPTLTNNTEGHAIFSGSLNTIAGLLRTTVYASILYELREVDFHARRNQLKGHNNATSQDDNEERWDRVQVAFSMLKNKIATAPIVRHFDPTREAVIIVHASEWAISASLVQY